MSNYDTQLPPRSAGIEDYEPVPRSGGGTVAFVLGGLVVAVVILFWALSDGTSVTDTTPADPATNISIDNSAPPPADAADPNAMQAAPADDAAPAMEAAPADDAAPSAMDAVPADDGAVVPAEPATDGTAAPVSP